MKKIISLARIFNNDIALSLFSEKTLKEIENIILYGMEEENTNTQINHLDLFFKNLSFFLGEEFSLRGIKLSDHFVCEIAKCQYRFYKTKKSLYALLRTTLQQPKEKRITISRKYRRKWHRQFMHEMGIIADCILESFLPDNIATHSPEVIVNYILNRHLGLGNKYKFNKHSKYGFATKIFHVPKEEIIQSIHLLTTPQQRRVINDWTDYGVSKTNIRILGGKGFAQDRIYFLFRNNSQDKPEYEHALQMPIRDCRFERY